MSEIIANCQYLVSCLGHNMTWMGIYGKPRNLVTDTVNLLYSAGVKNGSKYPKKIILMNTDGFRNIDLNEPVSIGHKVALFLIRLLLPPHLDNENAAEFLRVKICQANENVEWVVVRPSNLVDCNKVSLYSINNSPIRSAFLNPGKTSRINVADFITKLIIDQHLWKKWKGKKPVIYNQES